MRNLFRQEKETKVIKDRILRDESLSEHEQEDYYKPVIGNENYIEHKRNSDRNKKLSVQEYPNKIRPYSKGIRSNRKKSDIWRIQLTIANNFVSSLNNDGERIMHSKSDNIEIVINDEANEVIKELSDSLKNRYQNNLESMKGNEFFFDYVQLLYYKLP